MSCGCVKKWTFEGSCGDYDISEKCKRRYVVFGFVFTTHSLTYRLVVCFLGWGRAQIDREGWISSRLFAVLTDGIDSDFGIPLSLVGVCLVATTYNQVLISLFGTLQLHCEACVASATINSEPVTVKHINSQLPLSFWENEEGKVEGYQVLQEGKSTRTK